MKSKYVFLKQACLIAEVVAHLGKEHGLTLPRLPIHAKTAAQIQLQRRLVAKKTLNTWLSKLRWKYRPKTKAPKGMNKTGDSADSSPGESESDHNAEYTSESD